MNTPLRRLATLAVVMFVALIGAATWVQYFQADKLNNDPRNVRTVYREFGNARGPIVVDGRSVAESVPVDDEFGYQRTYSDGSLYSAVTGFYSIIGRTMLESAENDTLTGTSDDLFFTRLHSMLTGQEPEGASVELTIDAKAQKAAVDGLGKNRGAVVAINPKTGAILALASTPGYDPNTVSGHNTVKANDAYQKLLHADGDPLENKAIQGKTYPPGSTFKLIDSAAALESGDYEPDTEIPAPDVLKLPQTSATLKNYGGESCSPTGKMTLEEALAVSCNTAFGQLGMDLGQQALREQAEKFGFDDSSLQIPIPVTASRFPDDLNEPELAQSAIGQYDVRATPIQMAMVSAAIANHGQLMTPYLVQTVRTAGLRVVSQASPKVRDQAVSSSTADKLRDMMVDVVQHGTGTAAQIPGVQVAGKTGTAQTTPDQPPHAWFTSFAPADDPQVAVAVIVEHGGSMGNEATGGAVAAPIAKAVMQAVLDQ